MDYMDFSFGKVSQCIKWIRKKGRLKTAQKSKFAFYYGQSTSRAFFITNYNDLANVSWLEIVSSILTRFTKKKCPSKTNLICVQSTDYVSL